MKYHSLLESREDSGHGIKNLSLWINPVKWHILRASSTQDHGLRPKFFRNTKTYCQVGPTASLG